jgi:hypothetical protein
MRYTGALSRKAQTPQTESEDQEWYYDSRVGAPGRVSVCVSVAAVDRGITG